MSATIDQVVHLRCGVNHGESAAGARLLKHVSLPLHETDITTSSAESKWASCVCVCVHTCIWKCYSAFHIYIKVFYVCMIIFQDPFCLKHFQTHRRNKMSVKLLFHRSKNPTNTHLLLAFVCNGTGYSPVRCDVKWLCRHRILSAPCPIMETRHAGKRANLVRYLLGSFAVIHPTSVVFKVPRSIQLLCSNRDDHTLAHRTKRWWNQCNFHGVWRPGYAAPI